MSGTPAGRKMDNLESQQTNSSTSSSDPLKEEKKGVFEWYSSPSVACSQRVSKFSQKARSAQELSQSPCSSRGESPIEMQSFWSDNEPDDDIPFADETRMTPRTSCFRMYRPPNTRPNFSAYRLRDEDGKITREMLDEPPSREVCDTFSAMARASLKNMMAATETRKRRAAAEAAKHKNRPIQNLQTRYNHSSSAPPLSQLQRKRPSLDLPTTDAKRSCVEDTYSTTLGDGSQLLTPSHMRPSRLRSFSQGDNGVNSPERLNRGATKPGPAETPRTHSRQGQQKSTFRRHNSMLTSTPKHDSSTQSPSLRRHESMMLTSTPKHHNTALSTRTPLRSSLPKVKESDDEYDSFYDDEEIPVKKE